MKVLHIININAYGGAEILLTTFLPALQQQGINTACAILCPGASSDAARMIRLQLEASGVEVYYREYASLRERANFTWLTRQVAKSGCDLVHTHLRYADIWACVLRSLGKIKAPIVSTVHGYNDEYMNKHGLAVSWKMRLRPYYWISRWVARRASGLVFISRCMQHFYEQAVFTGKTAQTVIYHGYPPVAVPETSPAQDGPELVLAGRIIERKGHLYAYAALKEIRERYPRARLHLLGRGPFESKLAAIVERDGMQDAVIFHGYRDQVVREIAKYHLAILPSYWEPFGLVFLDAFAARVPVIAFDLPAGNEIIRNGYNGLLAKPYDSAGLAGLIREAWENKALRATLTENAADDLEKRFSLERMAKEYHAFYDEVAAKKKPRGKG